MPRINRIPQVFLGTVICAGFFNFPVPAKAAGGEWFMGVDATTMEVSLNDGHYSIPGMRVRAGYAFTNRIAVEVQAIGGNNSDTDLNYFGLRKWSSGNTYGLFLKPYHSLFRGKADVYGLVGVSVLSTRYQLVGTSIEERESVPVVAVGAGMQYNFNQHFGVGGNFMLFHGEPDYPSFPSFSSDCCLLDGIIIGAGVTYKF